MLIDWNHLLKFFSAFIKDVHKMLLLVELIINCAHKGRHHEKNDSGIFSKFFQTPKRLDFAIIDSVASVNSDG